MTDILLGLIVIELAVLIAIANHISGGTNTAAGILKQIREEK